MKRFETIAVVGVGLIGGSIGLAARRAGLARHVVGIGRRASSLRTARSHGCVTATTTNLARGVSEAELVVVCTPVEFIAAGVREVAEHCPAGTIITDAGSTKEQIVAELSSGLPAGAVFIGSHPLAGSEKNGSQHARADLFEGRKTIVTPTPRNKSRQVSTLMAFWRALGSQVVKMTPAEHDAALAVTSHLPHVLAAALAAATDEDLLKLVAGGWLDTTRVAGGDPELWRQILSSNRRYTLKALAKFEKVLASLHQALENDEERMLVQILQAGKRSRDAVGS
jgi:prephenate dehydrogenase